MSESSDERVEGLRFSRSTWVWLLASATGMWCLALLLWALGGLDEALVRMAAGLDPAGLPVAAAKLASRVGMPVIAVVHLIGLAASLGASGRERRKLYLVTLLCLGIAGVAGDLLKLAVERPRPPLACPELSFAVDTPTSSAFPSGHATKSLALALPLVLLASGWRRWQGVARGLVACLAVGVAVSRVVLGVHFFSDVVGGLAMALSGVPLAILAGNAILSQMKPADFEFAGKLWLGVYAFLIFVLLKLS